MSDARLASVVFVLLGASAAVGCHAQDEATNEAAGDTGGDAASRPVTDAGVDSRSATDAPATQSSDGAPAPVDSGASVDAAAALAMLGACLGEVQAVTVSGQLPYVAVPVGSQSGEFLLDFGSTYSSIDLHAFATVPPTSGCDPTILGQVCTVPGFTFFGPAASATLTTEDFSGGDPSLVRQAGIVGTDFLSEGVFTIAYGAGQAFAAKEATFCSDVLLAQAGFEALTTAGYYENDLDNLVAFTTVDSMGESGSSVPNVPTVPVRIGGATAIAQLDTGFDDDLTKFSVNVNRAFLAAIQAASPNALVRDTTLDISLSTCVNGVSEPVQGYRPAAGAAFEFVAVGGGAARSYANAAIFVKNTPAAAQSCGGIGTWTVPAAQVAASYFVDMGVVAFDPYHERVWIPTN